MKTFILVSNKDWQINFFKENLFQDNIKWHYISTTEDFKLEKIKLINPEKIFFTHWSHKIENEIYSNYECILFHMTDLPYGRGGSPLQNLIVNGKTETKISAIKVVKEIDAGDIYLKKELSLKGNATEIFQRAVYVINEMISEIIKTNPIPQAQNGEVVLFKRRKPEDGNLLSIKDINIFYDYIRMLDAEGYPNAFIETEHMKIEFNSAELNNNQTITAHVRITKK